MKRQRAEKNGDLVGLGLPPFSLLADLPACFLLAAAGLLLGTVTVPPGTVVQSKVRSSWHRDMRVTLAALLALALALVFNHRAEGRRTATAATPATTTTAPAPAGALTAYNMSVVTWNLAEKKPSERDCAFLKEFRGDDFVVIGVQECENIKPRREEGHRSRAWRALQVRAMPTPTPAVAAAPPPSDAHLRRVYAAATLYISRPFSSRAARRAGQAVRVPGAAPPRGHAAGGVLQEGVEGQGAGHAGEREEGAE